MILNVFFDFGPTNHVETDLLQPAPPLNLTEQLSQLGGLSCPILPHLHTQWILGVGLGWDGEITVMSIRPRHPAVSVSFKIPSHFQNTNFTVQLSSF